MLASFPGSPLTLTKNPFLGRAWERGYLHAIAVLLVSCPTCGDTVKTEASAEERINRNGSRERVKWLQSTSIAKEKKINRWRSQWKNMAILFHLLGMKSNQTMKRNSCRLWTNKTYVCGRYLLILQMHSNKAITAQNKHYCYRFFWYRGSRIFAVKLFSLEYRSNENQTCKKIKICICMCYTAEMWSNKQLF